MLRHLFSGIILLALLNHSVGAEVIDRVVAFIDNEAITLSELEEAYLKGAKIKPDITRLSVLNTMINRFLLLREAKKLRLEATDDEAIITEYIDLKVRALIKVSEKDIENFYNENQKEFKGLKPSDVRDRIEGYLREKELNVRWKKHIEELRAGSYIKVINAAIP